jgi:hypothetical protein
LIHGIGVCGLDELLQLPHLAISEIRQRHGSGMPADDDAGGDYCFTLWFTVSHVKVPSAKDLKSASFNEYRVGLTTPQQTTQIRDSK